MRAFVTSLSAAALGFAALAALPPVAAAETIKIGVLKVSACGPLMIAQEKGYFAQEGLTAELVFSDAPILVPQGVMAGALDFGLAANSAAFFNTANQGAMRIIAADGDESPGFRGLVVVASNQAYDSGLKSLKDFAGRSFAITAAGTLQQYDLGVLAGKYGFDYGSVKMLPVGSFANMISAVVGGSADSAIPALSVSRQAIAGAKVHNLAWISDEMRMQIAVVMTGAKMADGNPELVQRFLRVYRMGLKDYHDAFTGPDERPLDGPSADATYAILAKYTEVPVETMKLGLVHLDIEGRLNVADVMNQIAWYKAQGMVRPEVDGTKIIDKRYVVALPGT
ncbi:MAG TPA: ABC transporter substrate-binding protein [Stellaceae bacterium]|jgi:NitT/TauT family transport system substrate-binding protein|nr:ABC transporter substrate-binding protein [Stellaceae bacterium]